LAIDQRGGKYQQQSEFNLKLNFTCWQFLQPFLFFIFILALPGQNLVVPGTASQNLAVPGAAQAQNIQSPAMTLAPATTIPVQAGAPVQVAEQKVAIKRPASPAPAYDEKADELRLAEIDKQIRHRNMLN
jgi:hypothetical protein